MISWNRRRRFRMVPDLDMRSEAQAKRREMQPVLPQPALPQGDLEAGNREQTQISEQIPPSTAMQQDDDPMESIKVPMTIGGITAGSMIGILVGNEQKKLGDIFLRINNLLIWASLPLSVILMGLTLCSKKNDKKVINIVKVIMWAIIVLLVLMVVNLFTVYKKSGNI